MSLNRFEVAMVALIAVLAAVTFGPLGLFVMRLIEHLARAVGGL